MDKNTLQFLLTSIQYLSIILSGILGILGLLFNYKDKTTGKLTKTGKAALTLLVVSLCLGLTSKIVEQRLKQKAEESEAARARIAAEQSLEISRNVERVVNAIESISVDVDLDIDFDSPIFDQFRDKISRNIGESLNDRGFSLEEISRKIPSVAWKRLIKDISLIQPVLKLYPKGSKIPRCLHNEQHAPLELSIPLVIESIEIPQLESRLLVDYHGQVNIQQRDSSQILSLIDFKGATVVGFMFLATKEEIAVADSFVTSKNITPFEKRFPVAAWKFKSVAFSFDHARRIFIRSFVVKSDECTGQPFFVARLED